MEILDLSYNKINKLPVKTNQLAKLKQLKLWHNHIESNTLNNICSLKQLEVLDIGGNNITYLPEEFINLDKLKVLNIDNQWSEGVPTGTCLDSFPKVICKLHLLESLSLSGQCLKKIPNEIGNLRQLKKLNLYANEFTELPFEIYMLSELEELNIDLLCIGNMIELCEIQFSFPSQICNLKKLKMLYIESRKMKLEEKEKLKECLPDLTIE